MRKVIAVDTSKLLPTKLRLAVLLDPYFPSHARIIKGISQYLMREEIEVDVVLGNEVNQQSPDIEDIWFDGIIANYADPLQVRAFERSKLPIVAVLEQSESMLQSFNAVSVGINAGACLDMAADTLLSSGVKSIGCFEILEDTRYQTYKSRVHAFNVLSQRLSLTMQSFCGVLTNFQTWKVENQRLIDWINSLPKPCGIIVLNESRARMVVDACLSIGYLIPEEVSIITFSESEMEYSFNKRAVTSIKIPLLSVGELCCELLIRKINRERCPNKNNLISPTGVIYGDTTNIDVSVDPIVLQVNSFIRENFKKGIKVQQVVDSTGYSRTLIERRYKEAMGYSIHKALHDAKLEYAQKLLISTNLSVGEIAKLSGYSSEEYLYRIFRTEVNMTPVDYREKWK
ncbi:AraC family transcriptional regulator [Grimontia sp. NTOU-MAR1]|uniref:AraC family transcriptional regulator n=1 Tax=Grimontia sp. NTOU-MAR1 TaxID=3111011 RepID=UPI002DBC87D8|nr:substrate-binding domain-containing protein [Grimontia sp. NTOU-MAR1]WRV99840.1 substrate-binding domain-containing protein [Grimontia sp. NTOU-MAR1]